MRPHLAAGTRVAECLVVMPAGIMKAQSPIPLMSWVQAICGVDLYKVPSSKSNRLASTGHNPAMRNAALVLVLGPSAVQFFFGGPAVPI
jgi:hypothetical protein